MSWSLGTITNNYTQPVGVQVFANNGVSTDFSTGPIQGGNINVIIPLRGTLSFVDGVVPGAVPPNEVAGYFLDQTWTFPYAGTTKLTVTIDTSGTPTVQQIS